MKRKALRMRKGFRVVITSRRGQVAEMVLAPGDSEGDSSNRHKGADQCPQVEGGKLMSAFPHSAVPGAGHVWALSRSALVRVRAV